MKRRRITAINNEQLESLAQAFAGCQSASTLKAFLQDICTPAELEALVDRWRVVVPLLAGKSYRAIAQETGVSVTTIGRVARSLSEGRGGYQAVVDVMACQKEASAKANKSHHE